MTSKQYKPTRSERSPVQKLQVWQMRLEAVSKAMQDKDRPEALKLLSGLRADLVPEAYPEFADNLDWLYRSTAAHLTEGKDDDATTIVAAMTRLLALARQRLTPATKQTFPNLNRHDGEASS